MPGRARPGHKAWVLHLDFRRQLGELALSASLTLPAGSVTCLLGPNGAGKTTLLETLAGLGRVDAGSIRHRADGAETVWDDGGPTFLAAKERDVGALLQKTGLMPHLDVEQNVGFALWARGAAGPARRRAAEAALERFGVAHLARQRPAALSGGQARLVGLARAVAAGPRLLLLDEPFAALDVEVAARARAALRGWQRDQGATVLLISHDVVDALLFDGQLAVIEAGRVCFAGSYAALARAPGTRFQAALLGRLLLDGQVVGGRARVGDLDLVDTALDDGPAQLVVDPGAVALHADADAAPPGAPRASIVSVEQRGDAVTVGLSRPAGLRARLSWEAARRLGVDIGREVFVEVPKSAVDVLRG